VIMTVRPSRAALDVIICSLIVTGPDRDPVRPPRTSQISPVTAVSPWI
jgi:hypothetical protein